MLILAVEVGSCMYFILTRFSLTAAQKVTAAKRQAVRLFSVLSMQLLLTDFSCIANQVVLCGVSGFVSPAKYVPTRAIASASLLFALGYDGQQ